MQEVLSVVGQIRDHYLFGFLEALDDFRSSNSPAAPEVLFELERDADYPFRLYRADMASNSSGELKIQEVNLSEHAEFATIHDLGPNQAQIALHPIVWNGVDFRVIASLDHAALAAWALRWLDVDDQHEQDANGLQGVIHSISSPKIQDGFVEFSVDFGSAPIEAFESLLHLLSADNVSSIAINSSSISEE